MGVRVAVLNHATVLDDTEAKAIMAALSQQVRQDILPTWNTPANLTFINKGGKPLLRSWQLVFLDDSDQANALGYHDDLASGQPVMKVFVRTCRKDGVSESSCASHELAEALVDPYLSTANFDLQSRFYATEVGDPVQRDSYSINNVEVSNFVLPNWFNANATSHFDLMGHTSAPFEVAPGGYTQFLDINHAGRGWQQVGQDLMAGHTRPERRRRQVAPATPVPEM